MYIVTTNDKHKYILTWVIMTSWEKKHMRQKRSRNSSRRPALRNTLGNISVIDVIITSMPTNWRNEGKGAGLFFFKSNIWRHGVLCSLPHLSVQTQEDEHDEETDGPQLRERHHGHSLRIGDESQARTWKPTAPPCHITICPTMNCEVIIGQWMRREDEDRINVIVKQNKEQRVEASGATAWKSQERSKGQRSLWT